MKQKPNRARDIGFYILILVILLATVFTLTNDNEASGKVSYLQVLRLLQDEQVQEFLVEDDGTLTLLRPGRITPEELSEFADVNIASSVTAALRDGERVLSPGMKYKHYAPKSPVALLSGDIDAVRAFLTDEAKIAKIAYISYTEDITVLSEIENLKLYDLGAREDAIAQSHNLFSVLRKTDEGGFDCVYAPKPKTEGVYLALYNRLIRAAAHRIIDLKEV